MKGDFVAEPKQDKGRGFHSFLGYFFGFSACMNEEREKRAKLTSLRFTVLEYVFFLLNLLSPLKKSKKTHCNTKMSKLVRRGWRVP